MYCVCLGVCINVILFLNLADNTPIRFGRNILRASTQFRIPLRPPSRFKPRAMTTGSRVLWPEHGNTMRDKGERVSAATVVVVLRVEHKPSLSDIGLSPIKPCRITATHSEQENNAV